jgi:hypothetical protein
MFTEPDLCISDDSQQVEVSAQDLQRDKSLSTLGRHCAIELFARSKLPVRSARLPFRSLMKLMRLNREVYGNFMGRRYATGVPYLRGLKGKGAKSVESAVPQQPWIRFRGRSEQLS